jgi:hypothetical protein
LSTPKCEGFADSAHNHCSLPSKWHFDVSRARGGKGLINNTGNSDFQTIILFMETLEFEKMCFGNRCLGKAVGSECESFFKTCKK